MFGNTVIHKAQCTNHLDEREETIQTIFSSLETANEEIVQELQEDEPNNRLLERLCEISNQYAKLIEKLSER